MISAAVAGASGYAGGEIVRLLLGHPQIELGVVTADSQAGKRLGDVHPHLAAVGDRILEPTSATTLLGHDVVFLALPHGASAELAAQLPEDTVVVDCGADYRLTDAEAWQAFYGTAHAGTWPYGLPELPIRGGFVRDELKGATRIAVPGCYPTACSLALAPGFVAGLLEPQDVVIVAASGTSGAGRGLKPHLLGSEVMGAMSPYGVGGGHRHTPEIAQNLALAAGEPVSCPSPRPSRRWPAASSPPARPGSGPARAASSCAGRGGTPTATSRSSTCCPRASGREPRTSSASNAAHLQLTLDESVGRVVVVAAIDNLTKGTAGGAIQCANLALGLPETAGLPVAGVAP